MTSCFKTVFSTYCVVLAIGIASSHAVANEQTPASSDEHARLAAILRQLNTVERLVARRSESVRPDAARYYFDYPRLLEDIDSIRRGIDAYLVPERAQPREPARLIGDYQRESVPMP